jgi:hypothetical protein
MMKYFGSLIKIFFDPLSFCVALTDHIIGACGRELELQPWNVRSMSKCLKTKVMSVALFGFLQRLNIPK